MPLFLIVIIKYWIIADIFSMPRTIQNCVRYENYIFLAYAFYTIFRHLRHRVLLIHAKHLKCLFLILKHFIIFYIKSSIINLSIVVTKYRVDL